MTEDTVDPESVDVESQAEKARRVVDSRLLTQDEFQQIEARQLSKQISVDKRVGRTAKRSRPNDSDTVHQEYVLCLTCVSYVLSRMLNLSHSLQKFSFSF